MKSTLGQSTHIWPFFGRIRDSEQPSGLQANIPLAIILEQILYLYQYQVKPECAYNPNDFFSKIEDCEQSSGPPGSKHNPTPIPSPTLSRGA